MQISFKILLDTRYIKKTQTYGLKLRVYQDGNYNDCSLGINLNVLDWNEQLQMVNHGNPNHQVYNAKLSKIKARIHKAILLNEDDPEIITSKEVIELIKRIDSKKIIRSKPDIIKFGNDHIAQLKSTENIGNAICYSCAINKLQSFIKKDQLLFEEINFKFLDRFRNSLLTEGLKVNSIALYFRTIRALFRRAIKEETLDGKYYPFTNFKIIHESTISRTLTIPEIVRIINLDVVPNTAIWHHRNLFLLSFCFIGLNFSDLLTLTATNFVNGRIVFRRKKTKKVYSILIHPVASDILKSYYPFSGKNTDYVLPFVYNKNNALLLKKDILQAIKNTNDYLKKIAKQLKIETNITTYYARYSWANTAKTLGYSKDMIAEALGHNYGNKVTGIYLDNYSQDIVDEMNSQILNHCFK